MPKQAFLNNRERRVLDGLQGRGGEVLRVIGLQPRRHLGGKSPGAAVDIAIDIAGARHG